MPDVGTTREVSGPSSGTTPRSFQSSNTAASSGTNDTSSAAPSNGEAMAAKDRPSIDEQVDMVYTEVMKPIEKEGQVGYVISKDWLSRVMARSSSAETYGPFDKAATNGEIGPIENQSIVAEGWSPATALIDEHQDIFIPLKADLAYGEDYQAVPEAAFTQIMAWYGMAAGQMPIKRYAHNTAPESEVELLQFEIYPPVFTIRKLRNEGADIPQAVKDAQSSAPCVVASRHEGYMSFLRRVKGLVSVPISTKVRLWRVLEAERAAAAPKPAVETNNMLSPPASREASPNPQQAATKLLVPGNEFTAMTEGSHREMVDMVDHTTNNKYNGTITLGTLGLAADQVLIIEEQLSKKDDEFLSDSTRKKNGLLAPHKSASASQPTSGRSSPAPSGIMTRGRARGQGKPKGTVGLTNLGNTCYMNSALQCIRSVEELTTYFLSPRWKEELNTDNPLGHSGNIAKAYAGLINTIYGEGQVSSFAPRNFKQTLGRYGAQFSGYGQQDSQEFMSFLVDGLHEDLNRIKKKPYRENPDSDDSTVGDPEAIKKLGETFRDNHRARNDSVAVDLFNGFYKNTMVCPVCDKVSITFDPFSLLTLQLPIENMFQHKFTFVPLYGYPVVVDVDMDKTGTIRNLKEFVAARIPGTDPDRMMVAEAYSGKFFRLCKDKDSIIESNIGQNDDMLVYELDGKPTNYPEPITKKKPRSMLQVFSHDSDDEKSAQEVAKFEENMIVPIFHRIPSTSQYSYQSNSRSIGLWPSFITLTKEEARSEQEIRRKVLGRVATMTTRQFFDELQADSSEEEGDAVVTTEDDASSTVDHSIQARSVHSEDDTVDISMAEDTSEATEPADKFSFLRKRPALLEPGVPLPEQLGAFFDIKVIPGGKDMVNTGWHNVDYSKNYPDIKSRIPKEPSPETQSSTSQSPTATPGSSDADDDAEHSAAPSAIPSIEEDHASEESEESSFMMSKPGSSTNKRYGRKGKKKQQVVSSRKDRRAANRRANSTRNTPDTDESRQDPDGALIHLKEAILIDWTSDAFVPLFRETDGQDSRKYADTLPDPELESKRAKRTARKKSGVSLEDCFSETSKGERLTQDNAWYCNRCKELRQAQKTLEIWTAPDILVVHLKRFSANRNFRDKVDILVDFPTEGLDLTDRIGLNEGKSTIYDLIAVDNHYGGLGGGHYTAFAKNFVDGKWYEYNGTAHLTTKTCGAFC